MHYSHHTEKYLRHQCNLLCTLQKLSEVYDLLRTTPAKFKLLTEEPKYSTFSIRKKSGGERHIENPNPDLKKLQETLNQYLQAVYYFHKTPLAYGFVINRGKEEKDPRDILNNARKHLGKDYLLNLDLSNFFHSVSTAKVEDIFESPPFRFQRQAAQALTRLTTFSGHLPMGVPTSPVLSNFAMKGLDADLLALGQAYHLTVTRYADDISFSANREIAGAVIDYIQKTISKHGFFSNENKIKYYRKGDQKEVTGLILYEKEVGLPASFIPDLEAEIQQLKTVLEIQNQQGKLNTNWVETFRKHLKGKINFVGYVTGQQSGEKQRLFALYNEANCPPPEDFGSYSWKHFHYQV